MIATITKVIIVQMMNNEFICKFIMLVYSFCVIQIFEYMQLSICNCVFMISGINLVKPINSVAIFLNYQFSLVLMKKYKACPKNTKHKQ